MRERKVMPLTVARALSRFMNQGSGIGSEGAILAVNGRRSDQATRSLPAIDTFVRQCLNVEKPGARGIIEESMFSL
jgi:hypothetical protein